MSKLISVKSIYVSPAGNAVVRIEYENDAGEICETYRIMDVYGNFVGVFYMTESEAMAALDEYDNQNEWSMAILHKSSIYLASPRGTCPTG